MSSAGDIITAGIGTHVQSRMIESEGSPHSISSGQGCLDSHSEQENFSINIQTQPSQPVSAQSARSISFSLPPQQLTPDSGTENVNIYRPPSQYVILSDIESYTKLGNTELEQGNSESALQAFLIAFKRSALLEDKKFLKICCLNLGAVYISLDKPRKGLQLLLQAATLNHSKAFEFDINFNFGLAYEALKHFEAAIHHFKLALRFLDRQSQTSNPVYGEICHKLAMLHFNAGSLDKSAEICRKACSFYEKHANTLKLLSCHLLLADSLIRSELRNEALISLDMCSEVLMNKERSIPQNYLPFFKELILKYEEVEDFTSAIESGERALKLVETSLESSPNSNRNMLLEFRGEMYQCTGRIYRKMNSIDQALLDFDIASETFEQLSMHERAAGCYIDMAHIYLHNDRQLRHSLFYAKSALSLVQGTGSAEEEQSLELLVVLYDKLGMNDKAVAAITASLSLVSARHHSDRDRAGDAVQRKHYSLLLQHFKDSLSQQAPGGGDKTSGNGAVVDEDYAEIRPPMMKGTAKKKETAKAAAGFPVDSGISNSSDNSAIIADTPSTEDTELTDRSPSTSKAEKSSKAKKRVSSAGDKASKKKHHEASSSSREKPERKDRSRVNFLELDEASRRRRCSVTSEGSISKKREMQTLESPVAKGLFVPGLADHETSSSGTLTPSGNESAMGGTALLQQYQLKLMQQDSEEETASSDADYYPPNNKQPVSQASSSFKRNSKPSPKNVSNNNTSSTGPSPQDDLSDGETEYASLRRSQSLTRKFLESQAHAANTKRANDLDMGNDSNDYGSLSPVSTRAPVAESIREHSRTRLETSTSGQMRSMRRSTSKRNNGLATHASFDTVPVHDISAYDQPGPSIREHTAEVEVYGNGTTPLGTGSNTYDMEYINPSTRPSLLKSKPPANDTPSPAINNNNAFPNVGKSSSFKKKEKPRPSLNPQSKACTIL